MRFEAGIRDRRPKIMLVGTSEHMTSLGSVEPCRELTNRWTLLDHQFCVNSSQCPWLYIMHQCQRIIWHLILQNALVFRYLWSTFWRTNGWDAMGVKFLERLHRKLRLMPSSSYEHCPVWVPLDPRKDQWSIGPLFEPPRWKPKHLITYEWSCVLWTGRIR